METFIVYGRDEVSRSNLTFVMGQILEVMSLTVRNCKVTYLSLLISRARELICPHTRTRSFCLEWDRCLAYVLVHNVSKCILPQAWERKIREIITHDLDLCDPYDGSAGHVVHLYQAMNHVLDAVICNDKKGTMLLLQRSKLRFPLLNTTDEFGWTLLHHATFHCATDVMKALVFEGISPSETCHQGQTPVHVAASSLRYGSLSALLSLGALSPTALTAVDARGHTPLHCMLRALATGDWNRKLSSQQLLDFTKLLLAHQSDLWDFHGVTGSANGDGAENSQSQTPWTSFASIVLCSDAHVAEVVMKMAYGALVVAGQSTPLLQTHFPAVLWELRRLVLLVIRRKKSRILASLFATFGELFIGRSSLQHQEQKQERDQDGTIFLHRCLSAASEAGSLRVMSLLLKSGSLTCPGKKEKGEQGVDIRQCRTELYFQLITQMTQEKEGGALSLFVEPHLCSSAFLLVPVLRGDSTMLRLVLDCMEEDPVSLLWLCSPCCPRLPSSTLVQRSGEMFLAWCRRGAMRQSRELVAIAGEVVSPLAAACLRDQTYLLKLLLQRHWCQRNTPVSCSDQVSYLCRGLSPVLCCILSGSVGCLQLLRDHFGPIHFSSLVNSRDGLDLLPLPCLMLLLRVKLRCRLFTSPDILGLHLDSATASILLYYSAFSPSHASIMGMLRIMLPHVRLNEERPWQEKDAIVASQKRLQQKVERLNKMRSDLQKFSMEKGEGRETEEVSHGFSEDMKMQLSVSLLQWEYIEWSIDTESFVSSLRTLSTVVCKKPRRSSSSADQVAAEVDEIRMNRQFQNITRSVVLLLKDDEVDQCLPSFQIDWWKELDCLIRNDFNKKRCKLGRLMMALRNKRLSDGVFERVREHVQHTEAWLQQGRHLLPPRKANSYFVHNCFVVLDVLHKWSLLVVNENIRTREDDSAGRERALVAGDSAAVEGVLRSVGRYSEAVGASPLMALLGEELTPLGMDLAVCAAGALLQDYPVVQSDSLSPPPVCEAETYDSASEGCGKERSGEFSSLPTSRRPIVRNLDDVTSLCNEVLTVLMEEGRWAAEETSSTPVLSLGRCFTCPDLSGLTPLLAMCTHKLWKAADVAISLSLSQSTPSEQLPSTVFFPGGLKNYLSLADERLSRGRGGEIGRLLRDWGVTDISMDSEHGRRCQVALKEDLEKEGNLLLCEQPIQVVDELCVSLMRRENRMVQLLLRHPMYSSCSTQELMALAYLTSNVQLCLDIALEGEHNALNARTFSRLKGPSFLGLGDVSRELCPADETTADYGGRSPNICARRFSNSISDFSEGYQVRHNASGAEELSVRRVDLHALSCPSRRRPTALCAARLLMELSLSSRKEGALLHDQHQHNARRIMQATTSALQTHQLQAFDKHGFVPVYSGSFAGLCLSHDGRVWIMDGSLMEKADFFSEVRHLARALPVPQTSHLQLKQGAKSSNVSGVTVVNSLVYKAIDISPDVLDYVLTLLASGCGEGESVERHVQAKKYFLSADIKKRSPVFLAVSRGNVSLARKMLACSSTPLLRAEVSPLQTEAISEDGLSYHFLKRSADLVAALEARLSAHLQGSYRENNVSGALMHSLMVHLDRVEVLWDYLQHKCEIGTLSRLVYDPSGQVVDCFQRAKDVLLLLNIPFSQLHHNLVERSKPSPTTGEAPGTEMKVPHKSSETSQPPLSQRYKGLSPGRVRRLVSWSTAMSLKDTVQGWVRLRVRREWGEEAPVEGSSLRSLYSSKMKQVMQRQLQQKDRSFPGHSRVLDLPHKQALVDVESSVLMYHSLDTSLVTYGFSSVRGACGGSCGDDENAHSNGGDGGEESLWSSPLPPLLLAETRHLRDKNTTKIKSTHGGNANSVRHMAQLLTMYKKNSSAMQRAMQCSYAILEFARTLSTTRVLVALTQEPASPPQRPSPLSSLSEATTIFSSPDFSSPSPALPCLNKHSSVPSSSSRGDAGAMTTGPYTGLQEEPSPHPVDAIRQSIMRARDNFSATKSFIASLATSTPSRSEGDQAALLQHANRVIESEYLSHGAGSRVRVADRVDLRDLTSFLQLKAEVSPMFSDLRRTLLGALLVLLKSSEGSGDDRGAALLDRYMAHNSTYDEKTLLEGVASEETWLVSPEDCEKLAERLLTFLRGVSINSITGVTVDLTSPPCNDSPVFTPLLSPEIIEALFQHVLLHPSVFCHNASVPVPRRDKNATSYRRSTTEDPGSFVPLSACPSVTEQTDVLRLGRYSSGKDHQVSASDINAPSSSGAARQTNDALKCHLRALHAGYRLAETLIELVLTVIGLHSMAPVYLLDFHNTSGGLKCSPYVALCYSPPPRRIASVSERELWESDLVDCFSQLRVSGIELSHKIDSDKSLDRQARRDLFSNFSELQYGIFCAALFGKARLFGQLLAVEADLMGQGDSSSVLQSRENNFLVWYVLLASPPPSNDYADHDPRGRYQSYAWIIQQLIESGYGTTSPSGARFSTLDLAALKQLPGVVDLLLGKWKERGLDVQNSLLQLGGYQFIALSKKFNVSTLQCLISMLQEPPNFDSVSLETFFPSCISDAELFADMFSLVCSHHRTYRELSHDSTASVLPVEKTELLAGPVASIEDALHCSVDVPNQWSVDTAVHILSSSLLGILHSFDEPGYHGSFYRVPHCPLYSVVVELTAEVRGMSDFNRETRLTAGLRALNWSNLHFALCGGVASKFSAVHAHLISSPGDKLSRGVLPCDLLQYTCFYSMEESLQLLVGGDAGGGAVEVDLRRSVFFVPLNRDMTPLDVGLEVGATSCVSLLLSCALTDGVSWNALHSCLGRGRGGEDMALLLLRCLCSHGRDSGALACAATLPIVDSLPRTGVVPGESLLQLAARRGFAVLCGELLSGTTSSSAVVGQEVSTALGASIASGHGAVTRVLGGWCTEENRAVLKITAVFRALVFKRHRRKYRDIL